MHLYEADARAGGHANTVHFTTPGMRMKGGIDVDTYVLGLPVASVLKNLQRLCAFSFRSHFEHSLMCTLKDCF